MKKLLEALKSFFGSGIKDYNKTFASHELDSINKQMRDLSHRRAILEDVLYGN